VVRLAKVPDMQLRRRLSIIRSNSAGWLSENKLMCKRADEAGNPLPLGGNFCSREPRALHFWYFSAVGGSPFSSRIDQMPLDTWPDAKENMVKGHSQYCIMDYCTHSILMSESYDCSI